MGVCVCVNSVSLQFYWTKIHQSLLAEFLLEIDSQNLKVGSELLTSEYRTFYDQYIWYAGVGITKVLIQLSLYSICTFSFQNSARV